MVITARALNRSTLARQLLLGREPLDVADGVRRVVALQAQQPASPYVALWNRLSGFDPADLDTAVAGLQAVKATLMRITLHLVHAEDYRAFREAVEPTLRGSRLGDSRFTASGLTAADADAVVPDLLKYADGPRTTAEVRDWLAERLGVPIEPVTWRMLRQYAPLWHAPVGGPWSFDNQQSYLAAATRPVLADPDAAAGGLQTLIRRYLEGFGPASVADMAQFALVQKARVRAAVQALDADLEQLEGADGTVLYDVPGAPRPAEDTPAPPRLMAMWDSILLAYADRSRVIPPEYRKQVTRINGDVLPTLLVDGYVAGVWRPVEGGIEASAFLPLPEEVWQGLAAEAESLTGLLADRDPRAYGRYDHWWRKGMPAAETRLLPGG
ncbi:winged helix DNA-binding domain-containing protein [Streptomyces sp. NBC_01387]|uniref:winged helix DNA-binding domain-containing protein n=1 Tax=unclassified Streptomyces TaxID=2593676 RepID=UPI00224E216C|nr:MULTISPECIES: winged helix DNA-binding domain-containing protein [unclassified Streptomyces]MCX4551404.1 winged helix DNA-binding domain-containing protein [Streptomyces sp. NBC_01500]